MPAYSFHVTLYLAPVIQNANTLSTVINVFYCISWVLNLYDVMSLTDSKVVQHIQEAGK